MPGNVKRLHHDIGRDKASIGINVSRPGEVSLGISSGADGGGLRGPRIDVV